MSLLNPRIMSGARLAARCRDARKSTCPRAREARRSHASQKTECLGSRRNLLGRTGLKDVKNEGLSGDVYENKGCRGKSLMEKRWGTKLVQILLRSAAAHLRLRRLLGGKAWPLQCVPHPATSSAPPRRHSLPTAQKGDNLAISPGKSQTFRRAGKGAVSCSLTLSLIWTVVHGNRPYAPTGRCRRPSEAERPSAPRTTKKEFFFCTSEAGMLLKTQLSASAVGRCGDSAHAPSMPEGRIV